ncbi:hypothetical protein Tco_1561621 [Tanacetum coccineum]
MKFLNQTEKELKIDFNKPLKEQDHLNELNDLANKKRKRTGDLKDHSRSTKKHKSSVQLEEEIGKYLHLSLCSGSGNDEGLCKELQFSLVDNSKLNVVYLFSRSMKRFTSLSLKEITPQLSFNHLAIPQARLFHAKDLLAIYWWLDLTTMWSNVAIKTSTTNMPSGPNKVDVGAILGVALMSLKDIDDLTKGIKAGEYEDVMTGMTIDKRKDVAYEIVAMWERLLDETFNMSSANVSSGSYHNFGPNCSVSMVTSTIDDVIPCMDPPAEDSPIVHSVFIQSKPNSYAGATGASAFEPSKAMANCRSLYSENLCNGVDFTIPRKVVETVFSEDGISLIASQIVNVDDVLKESLTMGVPLIDGLGFSKETVRIEYEWKPPRCDLCKIFGHVHDQCPKNITITPIVEESNDGFQTVVNKRKNGKTGSNNGG